MALQFNPVSGYEFSTELNPTNDCACNDKVYCRIVAENNPIYFQLMPGSNINQFVDGCPSMTDPCYADFTIELSGAWDEDFNRICWDGFESAGADMGLLYKSTTQEQDKVYIIKVTISNYESGEWFAYINDLAVQSTYYQEGGTFYFKLTAVNATADQDWGIGIVGGLYSESTPSFCIEGLELYEYCQVTAKLTDSEGNEITDFLVTDKDSGAVVISGQPGELGLEDKECYKIKVYDCTLGGGPSTLPYYSNCITYIEEADCSLLFLKWRADTNAFGFDYTSVNDYNNAWAKGKLKHPVFPGMTTNMLSSTGVTTKTYSRMQKVYKLTLNDLPDYLLESIAAGLLHSEFLVDGTQYVLYEAQDITPEWRNSNELAPVEVQLVLATYDKQMANC